MNASGNTILVTGGSSGIGLSLARRFWSLKNRVIVTGRNKDKLWQLKNELPGIETFSGDLTHKSVLDDLALFIEQKHPDLNILINNAAVQFNYNFADDADLISKIEYEITANLTAPVKLTALMLPLLLNNKHGAVINVSSGLMISPKETASVYCATKSAMHSFSKSLRYQLENTRIKVFEIIPSLVDTPMTAGRGKSKILPDQLTDEFIKNFNADIYESYIGKAKLLKTLHRFLPHLADQIMKRGL